jgi:hypothetical protein
MRTLRLKRHLANARAAEILSAVQSVNTQGQRLAGQVAI